MSNQQIMIDEPASNLADKYLDAEGVTIGSTLMLRERTEIAGSTASGIADVLTVDPGTSAPGLTVRDVLGTIIASRLAGTLNVQFDPGHTLGAITTLGSITNTVGVYLDATKGTVQVKLDPSSVVQISNSPAVTVTSGTVTANAGTGSFNVQFDPGHTLGKVDAGSGTFTVKTDPSSVIQISNTPNVNVSGQSATLNVALDPGHTLGIIDSINKTVAVFFSPANPSVSATFSAASMEVVPTTGSRKMTDDASAAQRVLIVGSQTNASLAVSGTVTANAGTGTFNVQFDPGHTLGIIDSINKTVAVFFSPANPSVNATFTATSLEVVPTTGSRKTMDDASAAQRVLLVGSQSNASLVVSGTVTANQGTASATQAWLTNNSSTASIFTVSGSTSGVSVSGVSLVSPSSAYNFKVYAFSLQTTGIVSVVARFTNGGGTATEFWRGLVTANQTASAPIGANLAVAPPGYLFATGTNVTLALHLDTATLVHYSVSYIKESA